MVRIQFNQGRSLPKWDGDVIIRTDGARKWKYVFQQVPARMGRIPVGFSVATLGRPWP